MAPHIHHTMPSHFTADTQREQKGENKDTDHRSSLMPVTCPGRRCEARKDYQCLCSYEVLEAIEEESVVIEKGEAIVLNRSTKGILLFMRQALHTRQLIEVHTPRHRWGRTVNVFDVRWIRPVQVESFGNLYLVGCRRIFGPCHYLSF